MFKFKITLDRHNAGQKFIGCLPFDLPNFSLPSTFKVNFKAKMYIYVNSAIQRCPNKIIKIFLIEDFFHLPLVSTTPVVNLELQIFPRIFEKFETVPM
jgi:hypothetical protein